MIVLFIHSSFHAITINASVFMFNSLFNILHQLMVLYIFYYRSVQTQEYIPYFYLVHNFTTPMFYYLLEIAANTFSNL